jgi:hypothetical protein
MPNLPSNDEITRFDGSNLVNKTLIVQYVCYSTGWKIKYFIYLFIFIYVIVAIWVTY